jgi:hypothetical protein
MFEEFSVLPVLKIIPEGKSVNIARPVWSIEKITYP